MREFFTRTKNEKGYATLYTRIRKRSPKVDIFVNSLIQVDIITWKKAKSGLNEWNKFLKTQDGKEIYSKMQGVDNAIDNLTEQGIFEKSLIDEAVANVIYKEEREFQRAERTDAKKALEVFGLRRGYPDFPLRERRNENQKSRVNHQAHGEPL